MHNEVPCPGWRKLQDNELIPDGNDTDGSDTGSFHEGDSVFLEMHDVLAQEERARWTGYSVKTKSAATKGGGNTANSKSNSKSKRSRSTTPHETIYPTAMESFLLVEEAKHKYLSQPNAQLNIDMDADRESELRRNLQYFREPLAAFAKIETVILEQKDKMRAELNIRKQEEEDDNRNSNSTMRVSTTAMGSSPASGITKKTKKKRARTSNHTSNILRTSKRRTEEMMREERERKPRLDLAIIELSLSRLDSIENAIKAKSASLYTAFEDLLKQANWNDIPKTRSFSNMNTQYKNATTTQKSSARSNDTGTENTDYTAASENRLAQFIRSGIDTAKYPLVAKSFKLHKDYQMDGCGPRSGWKSSISKCGRGNLQNGLAQMQMQTENNNNNISSSNTITNTNTSGLGEIDEEHTLTYNGFSLPIHALNSEPDSDDDSPVANPLLAGSNSNSTENVWTAVRKRLARTSNPFLKEAVQPTDVELDININIRNQASIIHPDDKIYLQDSAAPNESTITHAVSFNDDDDLSPLDMSPVQASTPATQEEDPANIPNAIAQLKLNNNIPPVREEEHGDVDGGGDGNTGDSDPTIPRATTTTVPPEEGEDAEMTDKPLAGKLYSDPILNANGRVQATRDDPATATNVANAPAAGCTEAPMKDAALADADGAQENIDGNEMNRNI